LPTQKTLDGLAGIQVDDTLMSRTKAFRPDETAIHSQFDLSSADDGPVLSYSGVQIAQDTALKEADVTQMTYIHKLLSDPLDIEKFATSSLCVSSLPGLPM
jgi:hypothetical protein